MAFAAVKPHGRRLINFREFELALAKLAEARDASFLEMVDQVIVASGRQSSSDLSFDTVSDDISRGGKRTSEPVFTATPAAVQSGGGRRLSDSSPMAPNSPDAGERTARTTSEGAPQYVTMHHRRASSIDAIRACGTSRPAARRPFSRPLSPVKTARKQTAWQRWEAGERGPGAASHPGAPVMVVAGPGPATYSPVPSGIPPVLASIAARAVAENGDDNGELSSHRIALDLDGPEEVLRDESGLPVHRADSDTDGGTGRVQAMSDVEIACMLGTAAAAGHLISMIERRAREMIEEAAAAHVKPTADAATNTWPSFLERLRCWWLACDVSSHAPYLCILEPSPAYTLSLRVALLVLQACVGPDGPHNSPSDAAQHTAPQLRMRRRLEAPLCADHSMQTEDPTKGFAQSIGVALVSVWRKPLTPSLPSCQCQSAASKRPLLTKNAHAGGGCIYTVACYPPW